MQMKLLVFRLEKNSQMATHVSATNAFLTKKENKNAKKTTWIFNTVISLENLFALFKQNFRGILPASESVKVSLNKY